MDMKFPIELNITNLAKFLFDCFFFSLLYESPLLPKHNRRAVKQK